MSTVLMIAIIGFAAAFVLFACWDWSSSVKKGGYVPPSLPIPPPKAPGQKEVCQITKSGKHVPIEFHDVHMAAKCGACGHWYDLN